MIVDNPNTVDGVEFYIEFDETAAVGQDAKVRVFTRGAAGRKVWLKIYNRALKRIAEIPLRKGVDPDPPTTWEGEISIQIPGIPLFIEREGPLSRWIVRHRSSMTKAEMEAYVGRKLADGEDPIVGYPAHGVSLLCQVWREGR